MAFENCTVDGTAYVQAEPSPADRSAVQAGITASPAALMPPIVKDIPAPSVESFAGEAKSAAPAEPLPPVHSSMDKKQVSQAKLLALDAKLTASKDHPLRGGQCNT